MSHSPADKYTNEEFAWVDATIDTLIERFAETTLAQFGGLAKEQTLKSQNQFIAEAKTALITNITKLNRAKVEEDEIEGLL